MIASLSQTHAIEDRSQVATARRAASEMAAAAGFTEEDAGRVALAVSEAATNILKHAVRGKVVLRLLQTAELIGIEVLALDRGPGISNIAASMRDGHSSAGTLGGGLGALKRLANSFDLYSSSGQGAAFHMQFWPANGVVSARDITVGAVCVAMKGEAVSGDDWHVDVRPGSMAVLVADGLGHGPDAARASRAAVTTFAARADAKPTQILSAGHRALTGTRGAAVSVASINLETCAGTYAGVGNIVARVGTGTQQKHLISHNGTLGYTAPRIQEVPFTFAQDSLLIMHSDGIGTHWDLATYPGLHLRHPALIAGVLYRDYDRGRDDATVVVVRNGTGS